MRTSLDHLPAEKQADLRRVVEIVLACAKEGEGQRSEVGGQKSEGQRSEVRDQKSEKKEQAAKPPSNSDLRPLTSDLSASNPAADGDNAPAGIEQIVLYGSHARGDWKYDQYVEDGITYEYVSDYDVLVITDNDSGLHKNHAVWDEVKNRFYRGRAMRGPDSAGLSLIIHNIHEVNRALEEGKYFFADIQKQGVLLYDAGRVKLASRIEPTPEERKARAREEFENWIQKSDVAYRHHDLAVAAGSQEYNFAAFLLHQATEHLYTTVCMVFIDYRPKLHDLHKLRKFVAQFDRRLLNSFERQTDEQKRLFRLLADAYVHARYSKTYVITKEELEYLAQRVQKLRGIVEEVCRERIAG